jgi:hypothetical protein
MSRFAQAGACALLLAGTLLHAGCSNGSAGLVTGSSNLLPADAPATAGIDDALARPVAVAWTSARAKRCAFYFDPAKLRENYLSYEAKQGAAGEQYAKIEKAYDTTYRVTWDKIVADPDYCSERKGLDIKADLQRYLSGDYTPNLPKPKPVASCGFWGCSSSSDEKFNANKFWKEQEKNKPTASR